VIRAVVDPGVLIAAVLSAGGAPAELLRLWLDGAYEIIVSEKLLSELGSVLQRPKFRPYLSLEEAAGYLALLRRWAEHAADVPTDKAHTPDPDNDYLVTLALSSGADLLVSGDRRLTAIEDPTVPVLTPRQTVELLERLNRRTWG